MKAYPRYAAVSLIALFAGLVATCDALVATLFIDDTADGWVFFGIIGGLFVLVVGGLSALSATPGTTRGDSRRAFAGLAVVGCLTPALMVVLMLFDPGDSPQQGQVDAGFSLAILSSLIVGGIVAGIGLLGFRLLREP